MAASTAESQQLLLELKLGAAVGCFVTAMIGCQAARRLAGAEAREDPFRQNLLTVGNAFASGILLAAALTCMLPDAAEALAPISTYPLASLVAGCAFCTLVMIGQIVDSFMGAPPTPKQVMTYTLVKSDRVDHGRQLLADADRRPAPPANAKEAAATTASCGVGGQDGCPMCPSTSDKSTTASTLARDSASSQSKELAAAAPEAQRIFTRDDELPMAAAPGFRIKTWASNLFARGPKGTDCDDLTEALLDAQKKAEEGGGLRPVSKDGQAQGGKEANHEVQAYMLFFALGFHSVSEGLGVGCASGTNVLASVSIAILAHKGLAAFALGTSLMRSGLQPARFALCTFLFSIATPLGCILGALAVSDASATNGPIGGICTAFASGTFMQVCTMELLPKVLAEKQHKVLVSFALLAGFLCMAFLAIWC
eukprot:TRINITY_DN100773_c0_g1_i1.p1 TRINITY_DN100773_c0_g1~~TRINITY_DN100773_c0_g1_i1.p1  ORF type:complete len:425 (+),score=94.23 TRINITY_DN100773_c0_g1_i1:71-1345(+)